MILFRWWLILNKDGKGVKIFAAPGSLISWLEENELSTEEKDLFETYPIYQLYKESF